jgi:hypothetical protein
MKYEFTQSEIDKSVKAIRAFTNTVNLEIVKMFEGNDILSRKEIEKKLNMNIADLGTKLSRLSDYHILLKVWNNKNWSYKANKEMIQKMVAFIELFG